jgi:hypothetical protein
MADVGLVVSSVEVVNNASLTVISPLTFVADTLVPSDNLPTVLRAIAQWNPVSTVSHAARSLFGNVPTSAPDPDAWADAARRARHAGPGRGDRRGVRTVGHPPRPITTVTWSRGGDDA